MQDSHHHEELFALRLDRPFNGPGPYPSMFGPHPAPPGPHHTEHYIKEECEPPKKVPPPNGKKTKGRVKIKMEFIDNKLRRYTTFSKRKTGIMKKAYELSTLTGTQVMLVVASETGHVYTFATRKLQPMITSDQGKALIQRCLNSQDSPNSPGGDQRMSPTGYEETELSFSAVSPPSEPDFQKMNSYQAYAPTPNGNGAPMPPPDYGSPPPPAQKLPPFYMI